MDILTCVVFMVSIMAGVVIGNGDSGGQYDWYDVNKGSTGSGNGGSGGGEAMGGGGGGEAMSGGGGGQPISGGYPGDAVFSEAAPVSPFGSTDDLISQLLSHTSTDDGLTLDLFNTLSQYDISSQGTPGSQDDLISQILNEAAKSRSNVGDYPSASSPASAPDAEPALDQHHLQAATHIYTVAKGHADDADLVLSKAKSSSNTAGTEAMAEAARSAKGAALVTIASAKAEARSNVLHSKNSYISSLGKLKDKVTHMRNIEKRFRQLAVAFAKVRKYAGQALLSLKSMTSKKDSHGSNGYKTYVNQKDDVLITVASAKARIAKMKVVEKRFLSLAHALAKVRAQTYSDVRKVRKSGVNLAKVTTSAQAQVDASVEKAAAMVSQAVATARAASMAKEDATTQAAMAAKAKAEMIVHAAAGLVDNIKTAPIISLAGASQTSSKGTDHPTDYSSQQSGTSYGGDTPVPVVSYSS